MDEVKRIFSDRRDDHSQTQLRFLWFFSHWQTVPCNTMGCDRNSEAREQLCSHEIHRWSSMVGEWCSASRRIHPIDRWWNTRTDRCRPSSDQWQCGTRNRRMWWRVRSSLLAVVALPTRWLCFHLVSLDCIGTMGMLLLRRQGKRRSPMFWRSTRWPRCIRSPTIQRCFRVEHGVERSISTTG